MNNNNANDDIKTNCLYTFSKLIQVRDCDEKVILERYDDEWCTKDYNECLYRLNNAHSDIKNIYTASDYDGICIVSKYDDAEKIYKPYTNILLTKYQLKSYDFRCKNTKDLANMIKEHKNSCFLTFEYKGYILDKPFEHCFSVPFEIIKEYADENGENVCDVKCNSNIIHLRYNPHDQYRTAIKDGIVISVIDRRKYMYSEDETANSIAYGVLLNVKTIVVDEELKNILKN